ncbi:MAG: purple acid phosphatase family protein [Nitritalea sp.]
MHKSSKRLLACFGLLLLLVGITAFYGPSRQLEIRHARVIWVERPATEAIISWTTLHAQGKESRVLLDTRPGITAERFALAQRTVRQGAITMTAEDREFTDLPQGFYHHAELKSLQPDTRYYFRIQVDGQLSEEYYFLTASQTDKPVAFMWGGDSRMGGDKPRYAGLRPHVDRQAMNRRIRTLMEDNPEILAFVHGADYGSTANWMHLYWWFEDQELCKGRDGRILPLVLSRGNHDMQVGFEENFYIGRPRSGSGEGYYFGTQFSAQFHLLTMNTEISVAGDQYDWLEEALARERLRHRWLVVNYHRPAYPVHKDVNAAPFKRVRDNWVPLFERYTIDLALESDGHTLKRTLPIRNNRPDESGIVYIGEGGLGVPQRVPDTSRWFIQEPGFATSAHNVHVLRATGEKLHITAFGMEGDTLDHYSRVPRKL